ncbi:hypothetical protein [Streptomyces sp. N35]|uniref:hypothetical protein n=1 Tax=Streptomyces sp. N35 TaxID=2795730 RepID=UPI0018F7C091|nr:hypothetical protein [Streptomyces sp. N35]
MTTTTHPAGRRSSAHTLPTGARVIYTGSLTTHHGLYKAYECRCERCIDLWLDHQEMRYRLEPTGATRTPDCGSNPRCVRRRSLTTL